MELEKDDLLAHISKLKVDNLNLTNKLNALNESYKSLESTRISYGLSDMISKSSSEINEKLFIKLEELNESKNKLETNLSPYDIINSQAANFVKGKDTLEAEHNERQKILDERIKQINFILKLKENYLVNIETLSINKSANKEEMKALVDELIKFRSYYTNNNFRIHQIMEENKLLKAGKQVNMHQILKTIYIDNDNVINLTKAMNVSRLI